MIQRRPLSDRKPAPIEPAMLVIFGASGDLTLRKLLPAVYHLDGQGLIPERFAIVAVSRKELSSEQYRKLLAEKVPALLDEATSPLDQERFERLLERCHYVAGDGTDPGSMRELAATLEKLEARLQTGGNAVFYLAVPPQAFQPILKNLGGAGLLRQEAARFRRVVIEKPFGRDLETARELNRALLEVADESQVFRIDHYLGKETVQNIMVLRFANGVFEPIWNRDHIDSVQITVAEQLGVEGRGDYYDTAGALRDMVPNHLFQLLSLVAMEPPNSFAARDVRDEKFKALMAIQPISHEEVLSRAVRGQYAAGRTSLKGQWQAVPGYRSEPGVPRASANETFVALKLGVDNWRWAGVPFYLRTGKRMAERRTEICITFKPAPSQLFRELQVAALPPNQLLLEIQPEERISLQFGAKVPGPQVRVGDVEMDFCYEDYFHKVPSNGYETLIYDCMRGDQTLFQRADQIERGWEIVAPIQEVWAALPPRDFGNYKAGSWGPRAADELLARDGRQWRLSDAPVRAVDFGETAAAARGSGAA